MTLVLPEMNNLFPKKINKSYFNNSVCILLMPVNSTNTQNKTKSFIYICIGLTKGFVLSTLTNLS